MAMLNVDPEKQADAFYRYKMPRVNIKVEGNGNGIKTVVTNIIEVCERLGRNVEYPMKFFAHELAATSKFKDGKWILTGSFTQEKVQSSLFDFIKRFVLCKSCRNPETVFSVDGQKNVWLNCKACSRITPVDPCEKLCNLLIKNEQQTVISKKEERRRIKGGVEEGAVTAPKVRKTKVEREEEQIHLQTRQAKEEDTITVEVTNTKVELLNPVLVLKEYINSTPAPTDADVSGKVFDIKTDYGLDDGTVVSLVFESLFDSDILRQIPLRSKLFKRFIKTDTEKNLIIDIMLLCNEKLSPLKTKFPIVLKKFYDCDVLSEEAIITWFDGKSSKQLDRETQKFFKEKSKPFVDWLREEEDEEEEEEEEEETEKEPEKTVAKECKISDEQEKPIDIDDI